MCILAKAIEAGWYMHAVCRTLLLVCLLNRVLELKYSCMLQRAAWRCELSNAEDQVQNSYSVPAFMVRLAKQSVVYCQPRMQSILSDQSNMQSAWHGQHTPELLRPAQDH